MNRREWAANKPRTTCLCAARTWHGCVEGQRRACSSPRRRPRLDRTNTATGQRHKLRTVVIIAFKLRGARPPRFSPRGVSADRSRSTRAGQCGLDLAVLWPNAGHAPPHAVGRGSAEPTPRQVGNTVFERCEHHVRTPWRAARALFAQHSISQPPTEHARRTVQTLRGCVVAQRRARSSPRRRPRLDRTNTATGLRHGL